MDNSSPSSGSDRIYPISATRKKPTRFLLKEKPLSPWLRLAVFVQTLPEHAVHYARLRTIEDFEIVLQIEGSTWIWSADGEGSIDIHPGDVIFLPPGYLHGWAYGAGRHLAVHFDFHANPDLEAYQNLHLTDSIVTQHNIQEMPRFALGFSKDSTNDIVVPFVTPSQRPGLWRERLEALVHLWQRRAHHTLAGQMLVNETITWALQRLVDDAAHAGIDERKTADPRILALLATLDVSPHMKRLSVIQLAREANMGQTSFRSAFTRAVGCPPRRYLEEMRVQQAKQAIIETHKPIHAIARMVGYEDPYHFSRVFKRITGQSPKQYRLRSTWTLEEGEN